MAAVGIAQGCVVPDPGNFPVEQQTRLVFAPDLLILDPLVNLLHRLPVVVHLKERISTIQSNNAKIPWKQPLESWAPSPRVDHLASEPHRNLREQSGQRRGRECLS